MESSRRAIEPVKPPAAYVGGKKQLAADIIKRIEQIPHRTYAEPFVGMGGVFFRRRLAPPAEVINDLNRDVATLFRVLQRHYLAFLEMIRWKLTSRTEFERLVATDPATLTDLERSARFLYLQRLTFGGKVTGRTFGVSHGLRARFDVTRLGPMLEEIHERLAGVVIECLPFEEFIRRYDRPGTLFYLDPPYWGTEHFYGRDAWGRETFAELAELLASIEGRFLLSLNDVKGVRDTFARFKMTRLKCSYSAGGNDRVKAAAELLIEGP